MNSQGDLAVVWKRLGVPGDPDRNVIEGVVHAAGSADDLLEPDVISASTEDADTPAVAIDGAGNATAAWVGVDDGGNATVRVSVLPAGGEWSEPVALSQPATGAADPAIALDLGGDAVVVWTRTDGDGDDVVQAAVREAGGWTGPVDLSSDGRDAAGPQVAVGSDGTAIAVWASAEGEGDRVVEARVRFAADESWGAAEQLSVGGDDAAAPQVAAGPGGDAVAIWSVAATDAGPYGVHAMVRSGGGWDGAAETLAADGSVPPEPRVGMDQAGNAVAVWLEANAGGYSVVRSASRTPGGAWSVGAGDLSSGAHAASEPDLAVGPGGHGVAAWLEYVVSYTGSAHYLVGASVRSPDGIWTDRWYLSESGKDAGAPQAAVDQSGNGAVAWHLFDGSWEVVQASAYDATAPLLNALTVPASGVVGEQLAFSVSPLDVWSKDVSVEWRFGDGQGAGGSTVSHAYSAAGTYEVQVTATDAFGNATTATQTLKVEAAPTGESPGAAVAGTDGTSDAEGAGTASQQSDTAGPRVKVRRPRPGRTYRSGRLRKITADAIDGASPIASFEWALARRVAARGGRSRGGHTGRTRCRPLSAAGALGRARSCGKVPLRKAIAGGSATTDRLTVRLRHRLRSGDWELRVRAADAAGNVSTVKVVRFRVAAAR